MRRALALSTVLCMACPQQQGTVSPAAPRSFSATDRAEIEDLLDSQRQAWNRGDLEGFMVAYHKSQLVFTSGGKVRRGWDETFARYEKRYGSGSGMGRLDFSDLEITGLGADAALVMGRWKLTQTPEAGNGLFTLVLVREPKASSGRWRIIHDHTSRDAGSD